MVVALNGRMVGADLFDQPRTAGQLWGKLIRSYAMDAAGDFVVAWEDTSLDGSDWGVFAQRYDATGAARGAEFQVNAYTTGSQFGPAVAVLVVEIVGITEKEAHPIIGAGAIGPSRGHQFQVGPIV